ncbi:protein PSK SIMULATOR 2-like isoform X1 [Apium graveolens]|uniref:protein PSK SIMULATOR 2-like isoform X1 n=1 Tax=Apium graveolens TaxID=4045 RepID=UPI003D79556A
MGGVCTGGTIKHTTTSPDFQHNNRDDSNSSSGFSGKLKSIKSFGKQNKRRKDSDDVVSYDGVDSIVPNGQKKKMQHVFDSGELHFSISRELKSSTPVRSHGTKGPHVSSFLGKAGIVGLERAVDVLDTLGSSMTNLNAGSGFVSNMASRGNKISILAFEVANTIAKGSNLLQSISGENIQFLKKEILHSEGVQLLVSTDMTELLRIAAGDKREEFSVFSREVIRFGDLCKDPQWHNLGRYFSRLDTDPATQKQPREEAEKTMHELTNLAQHTSELYHELHALDRFEQDYRRKLEEVESLHLPRKGEGLVILHSELKHQRKLVKSLQKKSLWSRSLEEIVEKLVDIVTFIHQDILEAFGVKAGEVPTEKPSNKPERLGVAGLALHYAHIITQIDNIACRPTSLPPNTRDGLYNGLPISVKTALRSRLQAFDAKEELTVPQIKAKMEETLQWLVPIAADTTKAHQGFGWVGEWANTGMDFGGKKTGANSSVIRLQTLYHADKKKMDQYILELVVFLHRLINQVGYRDNGFKALPVRSPTNRGVIPLIETQGPSSLDNKYEVQKKQLSPEDRNLLEEVVKQRKMIIGRSKSQEFVMGRRGSTKVWALSRSTGSSPRRFLQQGHQKSSILDILDGMDQHELFSN